MKEKAILKGIIKEQQIDEFLAKKFEKAGYSHCEIQRTPLATRIMVYARFPGLVVGRSGKKVKEIAEELKEKFGIENPLIEGKEVTESILDPNIVAQLVAKAIERGGNPRRVASFYLEKILEAGAKGAQIMIGGKLAQKAKSLKFSAGYMKHAGAKPEKACDQALIPPGIVGVKVKILK